MKTGTRKKFVVFKMQILKSHSINKQLLQFNYQIVTQSHGIPHSYSVAIFGVNYKTISNLFT